MSESLSDAVREAAQKEALGEFRYAQFSMTHPIAFIRGAVWAVGRLPNRDEIAAVLLGQHVDFYDETSTLETADEILALIRQNLTKEDNDNT